MRKGAPAIGVVSAPHPEQDGCRHYEQIKHQEEEDVRLNFSCTVGESAPALPRALHDCHGQGV